VNPPTKTFTGKHVSTKASALQRNSYENGTMKKYSNKQHVSRGETSNTATNTTKNTSNTAMAVGADFQPGY